jgi:phosphatidylserine/phosphatidylglycerophosphate/cardiolipin synthase-like enzyme
MGQPWRHWPAHDTLRLAQWLGRSRALPSAEALAEEDFPAAEALREALGAALAKLGGLGALAEALAWVGEAQAEAERQAAGALQWVLTGGGPEGHPGRWARRTDAALAELVGSARERVWLTSYRHDAGGLPLALLAQQAMAQPGLQVRLGLHVNREGWGPCSVPALLQQAAQQFWRQEWPQEAPEPELYAWAHAFRDEPAERGSLHAKLLLVDGQRALVGSANLTQRAMGRNLEAGALLQAPAHVAALMAWLDGQVAEGHLVPLPKRGALWGQGP